MKKYLLILAILFFLSFSVADARSGCCSWHGGVSYCDSSVGQYVCNDGTYSPSCGCYKKQPNFFQNIIDEFQKVATIKQEIQNATANYYENPNGFRENLINTLMDKLNISPFYNDNNYSSLTYWVYTMLPDVK